MDISKTKSLDHVVLPVSSLKVARTRLSELGFTVAPDGHHPFGTENACVFFKTDTYLEPLAIADRKKYQREADHGNQFLQRDQLYRQRNGDNGFSLIAVGSESAVGDKQINEKHGYNCGSIISFRRDVVQPDGSRRQLGVDLSVATIEQSPDLALFSCQWLSGKVFDPAHMVHANGAIGIISISIGGINNDEAYSYLQVMSGQTDIDILPAADGSEDDLVLANSKINVMSNDELSQNYDISFDKASNGPKAMAIDFSVSDLFYTAVVLRISGIASKQIGKRLVVSPADGQGYTIAFIQQDGS